MALEPTHYRRLLHQGPGIGLGKGGFGLWSFGSLLLVLGGKESLGGDGRFMRGWRDGRRYIEMYLSEQARVFLVVRGVSSTSYSYLAEREDIQLLRNDARCFDASKNQDSVRRRKNALKNRILGG